MISRVLTRNVSANLHYFRFLLFAWATYPNLSNRCSHNYDPSISRIFRVEYLVGFRQLAQLCTWRRAAQIGHLGKIGSPRTNWPSRYSAHLSAALQNRWDCEVSEFVKPRYLARMVKQSTLWITTLFNKFETHYPFVKFIIIFIGCWIFPELTHYFF